MTFAALRGSPSALLRAAIIRQHAWRGYHAGPSRFGRYDQLLPSAAITSWPEPLPVPSHIPRPGYVPRKFWSRPWDEDDIQEIMSAVENTKTASVARVALGSEAEEGVRMVGKMASEVLEEVGRLVKPGVTTAAIDEAVHEMIISRGAYPSPLGYSAFPKSCTTSVNNVIARMYPLPCKADADARWDTRRVCLGRAMADVSRPLLPTDIVNVDLTLYFGGCHGDTSQTFLLPEVDEAGRNLVKVTQEALYRGIAVCGPGKPFAGIGNTIEEYVRSKGYSVNDQFSGHGIGKEFHQEPWILHYRNSDPGVMQPGDCFTIEPCVVQGLNPRGEMWEDGWTMATKSGARSAQFEHQILITNEGYDILTKRVGESVPPP